MKKFLKLSASSDQGLLALLLLLVVVAIPQSASAAPKTDIIIFKNGDKLTGELKSLKRGRLNFNTDATGTIGIEWDKIARIESLQNVQVENSSGLRYFGHLVAAEKDFRVVVETDDGPKTLFSPQVITMTPIEKQGREAFDIEVSFGYDFTKATGVKQGTLGIDVDYRTLLRIYSFQASLLTSDSSEQDSSQRKNVGFQYTRLWRDRWFVKGSLTLDQNDELGLNLRTSLGGTGGRILRQTNHMLLTLEGGLQFSRENTVAVPEDTDSIEAVFTLDWDWFRFDNPELDWSTTVQVIPNLTDWGRVRGEFDTSLKWEMIGDLDWVLTFYSSFDSDPRSPDPDASTNDYGIKTTLAYDF